MKIESRQLVLHDRRHPSATRWSACFVQEVDRIRDGGYIAVRYYGAVLWFTRDTRRSSRGHAQGSRYTPYVSSGLPDGFVLLVPRAKAGE